MLAKNIIAAVSFFLLSVSVKAQDKFFTKSGKIEFISNAPLEDIDASNKSVTAVLDSKTGSLQFAVLMKGFEFEKALMQEHFNDDYVESDQYPKAEFKGTITNNNEINYSKAGTYTAKVAGKLTLHGVTRDVATTGIVKVAGDGLKTTSTFNIKVSDYKIKIPSLVKNKVSNNVKIIVDCKLDPLK